MNPLWLLRMARWARRPPPLQRVLIVAVVVVLSLGVAGAEWLWGWPDWLTVNGRVRLPKP